MNWIFAAHTPWLPHAQGSFEVRVGPARIASTPL
jgi:hypothetical protein